MPAPYIVGLLVGFDLSSPGRSGGTSQSPPRRINREARNAGDGRAEYSAIAAIRIVVSMASAILIQLHGRSQAMAPVWPLVMI